MLFERDGAVVSSVTFTYDANGNTLTKVDASGTTSYTWDIENRLTSVQLPNSSGAIFKYDPFGRRIQKWSAAGVTNYVYDGANIVAEYDSTGALVARYAQGQGVDQPLAVVRQGVAAYYNADGLGSITSLRDVNGAVVGTYSYDAFGNTTATSAINNPFQYTGREWDAETGLYYYRARYYEPGTGRFISEDPAGFASGGNFYAYVSNNPVSFIDPSGLQQQGAPPYDPGPWNDSGHVSTNNCYSYACNRLHPPGPKHRPQPGEDQGYNLPPNFKCLEVKIGARKDGLKNGKAGNCPCGYVKVRLYWTANFMDTGYPDYHWYRQDSNGSWSSKHGGMPVGPQVSNPDLDAASWGYNVFCGTMCVPSKH